MTLPEDQTVEAVTDVVRNRADIVLRLQQRRDTLVQLDVARLALFGSAARDRLESESDVDLLVEFTRPATFDRYMNLKLFLEDLLGRRVDLVTRRALKPTLQARIHDELVHVA